MDEGTIKERAEKIKNQISMLQIKYGAQQVGPITMSIGISVYPQHGQTPAELIESADKALYLAKANGRNQIVLYSDLESRNYQVNLEKANNKSQPLSGNLM